jgi:hypothetical protein
MIHSRAAHTEDILFVSASDLLLGRGNDESAATGHGVGEVRRTRWKNASSCSTRKPVSDKPFVTSIVASCASSVRAAIANSDVWL